MKKLVICFLCIMLLAFGAQAHALLITPGDEVLSGNETGQPQINTAIASLVGDELYKMDDPGDPGDESGPLAGSYATVFDNPGDPMAATITYTGGDIVGSPAHLLVKDGNQTPAWYLFDLTDLGWDGMMDLQLENFWPRQGAISHVTLYGGIPIPEPATMLLLGTGIFGLVLFGRKKIKV